MLPSPLQSVLFLENLIYYINKILQGSTYYIVDFRETTSKKSSQKLDQVAQRKNRTSSLLIIYGRKHKRNVLQIVSKNLVMFSPNIVILVLRKNPS